MSLPASKDTSLTGITGYQGTHSAAPGRCFACTTGRNVSTQRDHSPRRWSPSHVGVLDVTRQGVADQASSPGFGACGSRWTAPGLAGE